MMVVGVQTPRPRHGHPLLPEYADPALSDELEPFRDRASLVDALLQILADTSRPVEDRVEVLITIHIANLLA